MRPGTSILAIAVLATALLSEQPPPAGQEGPSPIRFVFNAVDFVLDSCETEARHAPETMAGGVATFDYDNDGDLDIFFTNGADIKSLKKSGGKYSNRLLANDGKGHFRDVTAAAGLSGEGYDNGVAVGDFDNDGHKDLFVGGVHRNALYRNNGDGTFSDVSAKAGLNRPDPKYGPLWSVGGAWFDANNDGRLDLFVVNYLSWDVEKEPVCEYRGRREYCHPKFYDKLPNQLYLNNGDGTFTDVSAESGIRNHPGKGMGVGVADYDGDGLMDAFVANDKVYNSLFHNRPGFKFEEVALSAGVSLPESGEFISGMGVDFRDLDNDGQPDISVVALDGETFPLFRNNGKGEFIDITGVSRMATLSLPMAGYSPNVFDFDNDGWNDIFVSRGHVQSPLAAPRITVSQHNTVFRSLEGKRFTALTAEAGFASRPPARHRGSAVGDFNGDGKLDIVVTAIGEAAEIWVNQSPDRNHWLALTLEGTKSARDAIGARIRISVNGKVLHNHVSFCSGYASSSAGPVHFGLGSNDRVDLIEIAWPSGRRQELRGVPADQVLKVTEPDR